MSLTERMKDFFEERERNSSERMEEIRNERLGKRKDGKKTLEERVREFCEERDKKSS